MRAPRMALSMLVVAVTALVLVNQTSGAEPTGPALSVSPFDVVFDTIPPGQSRSRTITVKSTGTEPVTVTSLSVYGTDMADFAIEADACTSVSLAPTKSCTFDAVFRPTVEGTRLAHIKVASTSPCPLYMTLAGGGSTQSTRSTRATCTSQGATASPTPAYGVPAGSGSLGFGAAGGGSCQGRARVKIHFHTGVHRRLEKGATVTFAGRTFKVRRVKARRDRARGYYYAKLSFSGLRGKRYRVKVRGTLDNGKPYARNRVFVSCVTAA